MRFKLITTNLVFLVIVVTSLFSIQEIPYGTGSWDEDLYGNHRVVIQVNESTDAVWAHISWRRKDRNPKQKATILVDAQTGRQVLNLCRIRINREFSDFVFQPTSGPGKYFLYYLPYHMEGRSNYPKVTYPLPEQTAEAEWLQSHGLTHDALFSLNPSEFAQADVKEFQAIDPLNSFYPMEVIATDTEIEDLLDRYPSSSYLLFPENRFYPIRMTNDLPYRWIQQGPLKIFKGSASRGEFYAFQIGVYACRSAITDLQISFSKFKNTQTEDVIPASSSRCFNTGGVDWTGKSFIKACPVEQGKIQALWCGIQVPQDLPPGEYKGEVTIAPAGMESSQVMVLLEVTEETLEDAGDSDPWRHSRLRWLDSTLALDDDIVPPFTPLKLDSTKVSCLGREVTIAKSGLLQSIQSYFTPEVTEIGKEGREILASPIKLVLEDANATVLPWTENGAEITKKAEGVIAWESTNTAGPLTMTCSAHMEFDGYVEFNIIITTQEDFQIDDISLEVPLRRDVTKFMMGMGFKGGLCPEQYHWKWDPEKNQDSAWIGDVNAGLQCSFRDERYSRPLNTNFYQLKPLFMPRSWWNEGKGRCDFIQEDEETFMIKASSGERTIKRGEELHYNFSLLITPFKTLDTKAQWSTRFYHAYKPVEEITATGANTINIHHANDINPYINYPFLRPLEMKQYIDRAHESGLKVKIYYTVRELTNRAPEIFALRSFGDEIFSDGPGGGFSWLQEHLVSNYINGWFVPKLKDAAIINSGVSRWHNYYLEGLNWLVNNVGIDGLYIDDVAFDRTVMKRLRKILDRNKEGALIDLHSANQFNPRDGFANSANLYLEHFPYINRLWFGEYFDYDYPPDFWLVEVSGIPFGLMGEMLQGGGNAWRGMLYGMTARLPWSGNPASMWEFWDEFGMENSEMIGYWSPSCPIKTDHEDILVTTYVKKDKVLISLASWAEEKTNCRLLIDWKALGLKPTNVQLMAPEIEEFQESTSFGPDDLIPVEPGKGWLLVLSEKALFKGDPVKREIDIKQIYEKILENLKALGYIK
ncbi:MAG: hypothetical protein JSV17_13425 [Candidatus Aminicenantes bacterium]|nr:MAG: hypothetical protein JSV17_13425 [Candidatus Aminicenantes bacterium]